MPSQVIIPYFAEITPLLYKKNFLNWYFKMYKIYP